MAIRKHFSIATCLGLMILSFVLGLILRTTILNVGQDKIVLSKTFEPSIEWDWELCEEE